MQKRGGIFMIIIVTWDIYNIDDEWVDLRYFFSTLKSTLIFYIYRLDGRSG